MIEGIIFPLLPRVSCASPRGPHPNGILSQDSQWESRNFHDWDSRNFEGAYLHM
jgi:hypothetical protein